jgi:hypothetical protein
MKKGFKRCATIPALIFIGLKESSAWHALNKTNINSLQSRG